MSYSMNSIKSIDFDMTQPHPSAMLVEGAKGSCIGVSVYINTEYLTFGAHEDQEGFIVAEGEGEVWLDEKTYDVEPGMVILLQPGVKHSFRSKSAETALKVYWFHAAV